MGTQNAKRDIIKGRAIPMPGNDIDTDRIIPARYLKCVTFEELGQYAFYDERFDEDGGSKDHPFNDERFRGGAILLVNSNFGCGSSREHAPQSLMRMGIQAIVGESFAEIFAGNCTALGIPTVRLEPKEIEFLMATVAEKPDLILTVDLSAGTVAAGDSVFSMNMPESYRQSLLAGTWDTTATLLLNLEKIAKTAQKLPYIAGY
jgi:3-isopropylmalate/(R)-2-methylmalate dehydratase small subunit